MTAQWRLCNAHWQQALETGMAPLVVLQAMDAASWHIAKLADLQRYAVDLV